MNKKGVSGVVIAILIIAIAMILISIVWVIISGLVQEGIVDLTLSQEKVNLKITFVNVTDEDLLVRVKREAGDGNLVGIKFVVEDDLDNIIIFEKAVEGFEELQERNFNFNLTGTGLNIITKVSVAPIVGDESGNTQLRSVIDTFNVGAGFGGEGGFFGDIEDLECTYYNDPICGDDEIGELVCGDLEIIEREITDHYCNTATGYCEVNQDYEFFLNCTEEFGLPCIGGECYGSSPECNVPTDCGTDDWVGNPYCNGPLVYQQWKNYTCEDEECGSASTPIFKQNCTAFGQICYMGQCDDQFICADHDDCIGNSSCLIEPCVCENNNCIIEIPLDSGTVNSIWPIGIGEFFDSPDLPKSGELYIDNYIMFTTGSENRCLKISTHKTPENPIDNSYIQFHVPTTEISSGDNYVIWETFTGCDYSLNNP